MGEHSVYRGDESTYAANGGKQNPIHQGKHRAKDQTPRMPKGVEGKSFGSRRTANPKYTGEND